MLELNFKACYNFKLINTVYMALISNERVSKHINCIKGVQANLYKGTRFEIDLFPGLEFFITKKFAVMSTC